MSFYKLNYNNRIKKNTHTKNTNTENITRGWINHKDKTGGFFTHKKTTFFLLPLLKHSIPTFFFQRIKIRLTLAL